MKIKQAVTNLVQIVRLFNDTPEYRHFTVSKVNTGEYEVRFLNEAQKMVATIFVSLVRSLEPVDVTFDKLGYASQVGYRSSFMLTSADEIYTDEYWARRKKPKTKKARSKGSRYKYQSKEERTKQVQAAKALLA